MALKTNAAESLISEYMFPRHAAAPSRFALIFLCLWILSIIACIAFTHPFACNPPKQNKYTLENPVECSLDLTFLLIFLVLPGEK